MICNMYYFRRIIIILLLPAYQDIIFFRISTLLNVFNYLITVWKFWKSFCHSHFTWNQITNLSKIAKMESIDVFVTTKMTGWENFHFPHCAIIVLFMVQIPIWKISSLAWWIRIVHRICYAYEWLPNSICQCSQLFSDYFTKIVTY